MRIPDSYKSENEEYITLPVIKKFCKKNKLDTVDSRADLLNQIEEFADQKPENLNQVKDWLAVVLKEGIKHVYICKFELPQDYGFIRDETQLSQKIESGLGAVRNSYFFDMRSSEELRAKTFQIETEENRITRISFVFSQILLVGDFFGQYKGKIDYPVFVDVDLRTLYISGRAKSKSNIYSDKDGSGTINLGYSTSTEDLIQHAVSNVVNCLGLHLESRDNAITGYRNAIYKTLHDFTFTPNEIQVMVDRQVDTLKDFIDSLFPQINVNVVLNREDALADLKIFVEKYISINYPDRNIFIKDREAYPVRLAATDAEFTKIDESAGNREPLQCKAKFFDNKKSMLTDQTCDRLILCYNRERTYFGADPFPVRIDYKRHFCIFKFDKYVEEEDIQNVLSRIIGHRQL